MILNQYPDILRTTDTIGERRGPLMLSDKLFKGKNVKETPTAPQPNFNTPPTHQLIIQELETELTILDHTIEVLAGRRLVLDDLLAKLKAPPQDAGPSGHAHEDTQHVEEEGASKGGEEKEDEEETDDGEDSGDF